MGNSPLVSNAIPAGNPVDQQVAWQPLRGGRGPRTVITGASFPRRGAASFAFQGTGPAVGYRCRLQKAGRPARFAACRSPLSYRGLKPGRYTFAVIASAPGEPYVRPAARSFRIR